VLADSTRASVGKEPVPGSLEGVSTRTAEADKAGPPGGVAGCSSRIVASGGPAVMPGGGRGPRLCTADSTSVADSGSVPGLSGRPVGAMVDATCAAAPEPSCSSAASRPSRTSRCVMAR
jgi:hypothetical protein